jgi:hypothetical protein
MAKSATASKASTSNTKGLTLDFTPKASQTVQVEMLATDAEFVEQFLGKTEMEREFLGTVSDLLETRVGIYFLNAAFRLAKSKFGKKQGFEALHDVAKDILVGYLNPIAKGAKDEDGNGIKIGFFSKTPHFFWDEYGYSEAAWTVKKSASDDTSE